MLVLKVGFWTPLLPRVPLKLATFAVPNLQTIMRQFGTSKKWITELL
jgi:hypothetical protein